MCEYCETKKPIMSVHHLHTQICIDGAHRTITWRFDDVVDKETTVQYGEINFCPMCGRNLHEGAKDA